MSINDEAQTEMSILMKLLLLLHNRNFNLHTVISTLCSRF